MKLSKFEYLAIVVLLAIVALLLPKSASTQSFNPAGSCNQSVLVNQPTATTTRYIQNDATADSATRIYICNIYLTLVGAATANQITILYGTGATCGTGTVNLTGTISDATAGVVKFFNFIQPVKPIPILNNLCITTSQAVAAGVLGSISYSIF